MLAGSDEPQPRVQAAKAPPRSVGAAVVRAPGAPGARRGRGRRHARGQRGYRDRSAAPHANHPNEPLRDLVDIIQYDSFAQPESDHHEIGVLTSNPYARKVVVYPWNFHPDLINSARRQGAHGYLSKTLPARDLVAALEAVHAGDVIVSDPPARARRISGLNWPGRGEGLTDRESEILALITQGKSNAAVAALSFLSPNTVKSYIRTLYRKIDVGSRTQAELWGVNNGFTPDHHRIDRKTFVVQLPGDRGGPDAGAVVGPRRRWWSSSAAAPSGRPRVLLLPFLRNVVSSHPM